MNEMIRKGKNKQKTLFKIQALFVTIRCSDDKLG